MHMEKIISSVSSAQLAWKHLHAHGENLFDLVIVKAVAETPPCTWRKFFSEWVGFKKKRNTSMHMEKIQGERAETTGPQKHLHAHGENATDARLTTS